MLGCTQCYVAMMSLLNEHVLKLALAVLFVKYTFGEFQTTMLSEQPANQTYSWFHTTDSNIIDTLLQPFTPFTTVGVEDGETVLKKINDFIFKLNDVYHMYRSPDASVREKMIYICKCLEKTDGPMFVQQPYNENELRSKYYWNDTHMNYLNKMFDITKQLWKKINLEFLASTGKLDLNKKIL